MASFGPCCPAIACLSNICMPAILSSRKLSNSGPRHPAMLHVQTAMPGPSDNVQSLACSPERAHAGIKLCADLQFMQAQSTPWQVRAEVQLEPPAHMRQPPLVLRAKPRCRQGRSRQQAVLGSQASAPLIIECHSAQADPLSMSMLR